jgi:hypothetical protein
MKRSFNFLYFIGLLLVLLLAFWAIVSLSSCSKYCEPGMIRSGRSSQHHDAKPFKATIRVRWIHRDGPVYRVRFENMKQVEARVYFDSLPSPLIKEGAWVPVDSLCAWDERSGNI